MWTGGVARFDSWRPRILRRFLPAAMVLACLAPASAQEPDTASAYRGLFGTSDVTVPTGARPAASTPFDLTISLTSLLETRTSSSLAPGAEAVPAANSHGAVDVFFRRRHPGRRVSFDLRAGSQVREYADARHLEADQQWAAIDAEARLSRRTRLTLSSRATYSPTYTLAVPFADEVGQEVEADPALGLELGGLRTAGIASKVALSRRIGRQTSMEVGHDMTRVAFLGTDRTVTTQRSSGRVDRVLDDHLTLRLRYCHRRVDSALAGGVARVTAHEAEIGLRLVLPSSPGTGIAVSAIPTLLQRRDTTLPVDKERASSGGARVGTIVSIDQRLSPHWRVEGGYQRALYDNGGYVQPVFAQTASVRLNGRLPRRLEVSASAAYSSGLARVQATGATVDSFGYSARVSLQASKSTAVYAEYLRTATVESRTADRAVGGTLLDRSGLRVGVVVRARPR